MTVILPSFFIVISTLSKLYDTREENEKHNYGTFENCINFLFTKMIAFFF